jgi:E3 ubiquitin-protein ligase BOI-like protein
MLNFPCYFSLFCVVVDPVGLTAAAGMGWRQPREQELLGENSQMSSIDFLQTGSAVSTGLALSLEDRRHGGGGSGAGNSSGDSPLLLLPMLDDDLSREVQRLDADMDRFIRAQVTCFRTFFHLIFTTPWQFCTSLVQSLY